HYWLFGKQTGTSGRRENPGGRRSRATPNARQGERDAPDQIPWPGGSQPVDGLRTERAGLEFSPARSSNDLEPYIFSARNSTRCKPLFCTYYLELIYYNFWPMHNF